MKAAHTIQIAMAPSMSHAFMNITAVCVCGWRHSDTFRREAAKYHGAKAANLCAEHIASTYSPGEV